MSTTTTYTGVRIVDMPDLGAVTDTSSVVGEHAGSGRFAATALRGYVETALQPGIDAALNTANTALNNTGRNLLHNPLMTVTQRGTGPWTTFGAYTADRWAMFFTGGTFSVTVQTVSDANRAQIGDEAATQCLVCACAGGTAAGDQTYIQHNVEGVRRTAGKTVTLSFWASVTSGTPRLGCAFYQWFGSGGSPSGPSYIQGQAVTLSPVFTKYSLTFSIPSVAGKTFGTTPSADYLAIRLALSSGATNDPAYGTIGTQGYTLVLWGMQLEVGSAATALEKPDPRYDLSNCQRFFQQIPFYVAGYNGAGAGIWATIPLNTPMRAAPTVAVAGGVVTNASGQSIAALNAANNVLLATATVTASGTGFFSGRADCSADL